MSRTVICFLLTFLICSVNCANIIALFAHNGKSHNMVYTALLKRVAERGHNVTAGSYFPVKNPPNNYHDISFEGIAEVRLESHELEVYENENIFYKIPIIGRVAKQVLHLSEFATTATVFCERLINFRPLLEALERPYDLVIVESFIGDCMLGLLHVYNMTAPIVAISSGPAMPWTAERVGVVFNPSYVPVITSSFTTHMSFAERIGNTLLYFAFREWQEGILTKQTKIIENKFGNIPNLRELGKNISLTLINTLHVVHGAKPLGPGLIEIGGMFLNPVRKPLPKFIERFLNESENGVVLFSLGSHIKTRSLPKYKEQIFINALSKLKMRVIWKFEGSDEEGTRIANILKVKWLPQYDLLQHDKIKAFITHGGMLGMTEAISVGKPMVVIPFFGDQHFNAAAAAEVGIAKIVSYKDLSEHSLSSALNAVLSEEMILRARKVSQMWHDRESSPMDTAVYHVERAIRWGHDAKLYTAARDLPFYQLALIDVAITIIVVIIVFFGIIAYLLLKVLRFIKAPKAKVE